MSGRYGRGIVPVGSVSALGYTYKDDILKILSQYSKELKIIVEVSMLVITLGFFYYLQKKSLRKYPNL